MRFHSKLPKLLLCLILAPLNGFLSSPVSAEPAAYSVPVQFFTIGDMPYRIPEDFPRFRRVISAINRQNPAFTVHVGDIISGKTPCTDNQYRTIHRFFGEFAHPLVYTPGDNEWTDCHRIYRVPRDPLARLETIREMFFREQDFAVKLKPVRQNEQPVFSDFVENARWEIGDIVFATLHIVGSGNQAPGEDGQAEFIARNKANMAWLQEAFRHARNRNAKGLVLFVQANPRFESPPEQRTGFSDFIASLTRELSQFDKPVLLVHGDSHRYRNDRPLRDPRTGKPFANFRRVCVFGDDQMHAVRFVVQPDNPEVFNIEPFWVNGN